MSAGGGLRQLRHGHLDTTVVNMALPSISHALQNHDYRACCVNSNRRL
jgi:hypothetical protein